MIIRKKTRPEDMLTAEKMYSINLTVTNKRFCLSLHYNGRNSCLFVNGTEIYKFKAKDSDQYWSIDNIKKTGFSCYVYDFSVDYEAIAVDDIKII